VQVESQSADRESGGQAGALVALIVLIGAVLAAPALTSRYGFTAFAIVYAVALIAWSVARSAPLKFGVIVALAIGLRVAMLFSEPRLSGDVFRYLSDGRAIAAGRNPYTVLPDDPRVPHREIPTIYPPHAELLFALVHWLTPWRLLLIAADVIALFLLRRNALAYALFPPLIFEGAWNGHVDGLAAMLLLVAWTYDSGSAAAASVGLKLIPLAAIPALLIRSRRRRRFLLTFALVLVLPAIPFLAAGSFMSGMHEYATRWVFNSPMYDGVFALVDSLRVADHLKNIWTAIKDPLRLEFVSRFVYFHLYSDFLTRCVLAVVAVALIVRFRRSPAASIGALLICSPALHPWYWLVLAPFASGVWLWLALCAPFSYLLYAGAPKWVVYALCYLAPLFIAWLPLSRRGTSIAESPSSATHPRTAPDTPRL